MPLFALLVVLGLIALLVQGVLAVFPFILVIIGAWFVVWLSWVIIEHQYYKSADFQSIKERIKENTSKCNDLNHHIESLKSAYIGIQSTDYGEATYTDQSAFNFKRPELERLKINENVHECSSAVCKNAQAKPFKYLCKYFNISTNEETLIAFENVLNDFSAAEQGKKLLEKERDDIVNRISDELPWWIKQFSKKLTTKLGFNDIDFSDVYFPKYKFRYVSPGGNSSLECNIVLNIITLEKFVLYLSKMIKFRKSIAGQRALMTTTLREKIKARDSFTCQSCTLSTKQEANLLLEIDHIIPLSKGGITSEENLQTLCWKCNRSKGSKMPESI